MDKKVDKAVDKTVNKIKWSLVKSLIFILLVTFLCGIYTGFVTLVAQVFFKDKANGSLIKVDGVNHGSTLIGQHFTGSRYMWGRFSNSETDLNNFKTLNGKKVFYAGVSNISPAGMQYERLVKQRVRQIKSANSEKKDIPVPVELVTESGSGLDPHISYNTAIYQIERIARTRKMNTEQVKAIIDKCTENGFLFMFGEKMVNVLKVNLYLDGILR